MALDRQACLLPFRFEWTAIHFDEDSIRRDVMQNGLLPEVHVLALRTMPSSALGGRLVFLPGYPYPGRRRTDGTIRYV